MALGGQSSSDMQSAAVQVLIRAVQLDGDKKFNEALACYEQGIRLLMKAATETDCEKKKEHFKKKAQEYLERAEIVKAAASKQNRSTHKQIRINDGDKGYSYETVFKDFIDETLTHVEMEDPYIRTPHQIYNFLRFCELLVKKARKLKSITLCTTCDESHEKLDNGWIIKIGKGLDYFKRVDSQFSIGWTDFDLRPCNETTIDIFLNKERLS